MSGEEPESPIHGEEAVSGDVVGITVPVDGFTPLNIVSTDATKYDILGTDMQILNVALGPGEKITTEPGSMLYVGPTVKNETDTGNCLGRCCSGNPCIMSTFTNGEGEAGSYVGLTPNLPMKVIPLDLATTKQKFLARSGAYFASYGDAALSYDVDCNPCTCCCAGQGCCRQTVAGDGVAFLAAMGTVEVKTLGAGEMIVIDTNSLVAWESTATLGVRSSGGPCTCCFGGEGPCNTTLTGPGVAYIQSMSFQKFKKKMGVTITIKEDGSISVSDGGAPPAPDAPEAIAQNADDVSPELDAQSMER